MGLGFLFVFFWAKPLRAKPASSPQPFVWDRVSKCPCLTWNYVDQAGFKLLVPTASASVLELKGVTTTPDLGVKILRMEGVG